ncbi:MAG: peptidylprolyl isomerase [Saprospiraceae bacterium]|nr:peptidylprolyl isomerase [Saprospiraceae bacterium]
MKYCSLFLLMVLLGCSDTEPPVTMAPLEIDVQLMDSSQQRLLLAQDQLDGAALAPYLGSKNPTDRYLAARAYASIQDAAFAAPLAKLLRDPMAEIQQTAAFSLGQLGAESSVPHLIDAFQFQDSVGANNPTSTALLEAVGKCGNTVHLNQIATVTTYRPSDQDLIMGQALAIYRFMLRGITSDAGTSRMIALLSSPDYDQRAQLYAANYLARANVDLAEHYPEIELAWQHIEDADVRMFLALALGQTKRPEAMTRLVADLGNENDYRVKCNIIRALAQHFYDGAKRTIHRQLYDPNIQVVTAAVQAIIDYGKRRYWKEYLNLSLGNYPWQAKIGLLHATNKFIPPGNQMFQKINEDLLRQRISSSRNIYARAASLRALCENPARYRNAINVYRDAEESTMKSAATGALLSITQKENFNNLSLTARTEIIRHLIEAIQSGENDQVAIAARLFESTDINFSAYKVDPLSVVTTAFDRLQLPRDIGAWRALEDIQKRYGQSSTSATDPNRFTHPIAWENLASLSDSSVVRIDTDKGSFTIRLMPELAPATVANFLELVQLKYYQGKAFHRVVPNFVVQGGGPGETEHGRLDYNIRSELNQSYYDEGGYVGMASLGIHTESAQWFVTHSATPHLDGKYTLFGKVIDGMSVIHDIEQGSTMDSLTLTHL